MNLTNLTNQVATQMLTDEAILSHTAKPMVNKIAKAGLVSVLALTTFFATGMAHADSSLRGMLGASALAGLLNNGTRPADIPMDCNVQGVNGYVVGGAAAAGSYAGNQIGGGSGKVAATVIGGLLAGATANNIETDKMRQECFRQQAQRSGYAPQAYNNPQPAPVYHNNGYNQQPAYYNNGNVQNGNVIPANVPRGYNDGYNNGYANQQAYNNYQNTPQTNYPRYPNSGISSMPSDVIVYATENANGYVTYVNINNSPGIASMRGQRGGTDPYNNPNVQRDLQETMNKMVQSHQILQNESNNYVNMTGGSRPIRGEQVISGGRDYVEQANLRVQQALSNYSRDRAFFAMTADNAATSGYNLTSYSNAMNYLDTPQSTKIAFGGSINRYSTLKTQYGNR